MIQWIQILAIAGISFAVGLVVGAMIGIKANKDDKDDKYRKVEQSKSWR